MRTLRTLVSLCTTTALHGLALGVLVVIPSALAQTRPESQEDASRPDQVAKAIERGVKLLIEMQEGKKEAEWPYEGVYRVHGEIPIGYRVGGSGIAALALVQARGYPGDERRQQAVSRATEFIVHSVDHPLMAHQFEARYDVRGWGYTYGLTYLLALRKLHYMPDGLEEDIGHAIRFFIAGLEATAIPERGGWNYSRPAGFNNPARQAPFMTGPSLQALFEAAQQGYEVDPEIVEAGLNALQRARTPTGSFVYAGGQGDSSKVPVPGSVGRMLVAEVTLYLAGRSTIERIRGAIDAFVVHWRWLDDRRAKRGTHASPYGIAPYYFHFAHYYAAQAVELLPEHDRGEYRRRINELLFSVQLDDGSWNDRVFARSANYGTSMAMLALLMPNAFSPARWSVEAAP